MRERAQRGARRSMLLMVVASLQAAAAPPLSSFAPSPPQWTLEVTSYGEKARDLAELFVPLFAGLRFSASPSAQRSQDGAIFFGPSDDFVTVVGRFNCVVLRYHGFISPFAKSNDELGKRAAAFRDRVLTFLASLPEPRPTTQDLDMRSTYCSRRASGAHASAP